jgi:hypothetical protein
VQKGVQFTGREVAGLQLSPSPLVQNPFLCWICSAVATAGRRAGIGGQVYLNTRFVDLNPNAHRFVSLPGLGQHLTDPGVSSPVERHGHFRDRDCDHAPLPLVRGGNIGGSPPHEQILRNSGGESAVHVGPGSDVRGSLDGRSVSTLNGREVPRAKLRGRAAPNRTGAVDSRCRIAAAIAGVDDNQPPEQAFGLGGKATGERIPLV